MTTHTERRFTYTNTHSTQSKKRDFFRSHTKKGVQKNFIDTLDQSDKPFLHCKGKWLKKKNARPGALKTIKDHRLVVSQSRTMKMYGIDRGGEGGVEKTEVASFSLDRRVLKARMRGRRGGPDVRRAGRETPVVKSQPR